MKKIFTIISLTSFTAFFSQITINSNFPSTINLASEIEADIKIYKGAVSNFAKYQMDVPAGINVSAIDTKSGNFTFENQRAKIVWVSVPNEDEFTFKLKVQVATDAPNSVTFSQKFYYLENNEKKEIEANPVIISISGGNAVTENTTSDTKPIEATASSTVTETIIKETKPVETNSSTQIGTTIETKSEESVVKSETVEVNPDVVKVVETKVIETKVVEVESVKKTTVTSSISDAGMTFKVQLGAYNIQPSKSKFSSVGNVNIDLINGMYKVTTGNFKTLDDAVKHRDGLKSKGYNGFIAKYKDGKRIN
jgi:hypothetical protein